jgi:hypothetical protein
MIHLGEIWTFQPVRELLYWGSLGCVRIGLLGLVWGEAHPLDYIIVILLLKSIEQPFYPSNTINPQSPLSLNPGSK